MLIRTPLVLALGLFAASATMAQTCPCNSGNGQRLNETQLNTALSNKTVCASLDSTGEVWQEFHAAGGQLSDWKGGSNPGAREPVGTWSVVGTGSDRRVRYSYNASGPYEFAVCQEGPSTYHFCGANVSTIVLRARITTGNGCGIQARR